MILSKFNNNLIKIATLLIIINNNVVIITFILSKKLNELRKAKYF